MQFQKYCYHGNICIGQVPLSFTCASLAYLPSIPLRYTCTHTCTRNKFSTFRKVLRTIKFSSFVNGTHSRNSKTNIFADANISVTSSQITFTKISSHITRNLSHETHGTNAACPLLLATEEQSELPRHVCS